jgi:choline/glycine/proline betaine transport protein
MVAAEWGIPWHTDAHVVSGSGVPHGPSATIPGATHTMSFLSRFRRAMNPPVFLGSSALILFFVVVGAAFPRRAERTFEAVQTYLVLNFGWFYVVSATGILVFVVWLAFSRFGRIRLGGDDSRPEFHDVTWFTMLLAAGMGIGLVFFGVAEPIQHYLAPLEVEPKSHAAVREAFRYSFFHWGLHPWAIYISMALPLAYFHFRHSLPLAPRSLLHPVVGDRIHGWIGHAVDILATVGTMFGIGTSLGLGAVQINAGLRRIADVPMDLFVQVGIIAGVTAIATVSVVTGLKVGIRRLSQFNMGLAGVLLLFVLIAGPTVYILDTFSTSVGYYLQHLPLTSLSVETEHHTRWQANWTLFYWSWWIAWSPFVGIFAARISRGRTIRQLILAMLLVPTLLGFFWFSAMGGAAVFMEHFGGGGIAGPTLEDEALSFYALLDHLPWSGVTSVLGTVLIVIFFVTSSDSGSLVNVMVTSGGHPSPGTPYRVYWCVTEGLVAATLLIAGGLVALRTASLTPALPMAVLLLVACWGLWKALRTDTPPEP